MFWLFNKSQIINFNQIFVNINKEYEKNSNIIYSLISDKNNFEDFDEITNNFNYIEKIFTIKIKDNIIVYENNEKNEMSIAKRKDISIIKF